MPDETRLLGSPGDCEANIPQREATIVLEKYVLTPVGSSASISIYGLSPFDGMAVALSQH